MIAQDTLGFAAFSHIGNKGKNAGFAVQIRNLGRNADCPALTVLMQPRRFPVDHPAVSQKHTDPCRSTRLIGPQAELERGMADKVGRRPAKIPFVVAIDFEDAPIVHPGDRCCDRTGIEGSGKTLLRMSEGCLGSGFGASPLGDVVAGTNSAHDLAMLITDRTGMPADQADIATARPDRMLEILRSVFCQHHRIEKDSPPLCRVPARQQTGFKPVQTDQLLRQIAKDFACLAIYRHDPPIQIEGNDHGLDRVQQVAAVIPLPPQQLFLAQFFGNVQAESHKRHGLARFIPLDRLDHTQIVDLAINEGQSLMRHADTGIGQRLGVGAIHSRNASGIRSP